MRSIIYLKGLLDTFTLNKNSKTKSEVQPWYCDEIVLPHLKLICEFGTPELGFEPFFELYREIGDGLLDDPDETVRVRNPNIRDRNPDL